MPSSKQVGQATVWRIFSNLVSHASTPDLLVWVSDRTQAIETGCDRRTIRAARTLLEGTGLLVDTQARKHKGVKVFQLAIPKFQDAVQAFSGRDSPPPRHDDSGQASWQASGQASGRDNPPQTEQNMNTTQALFELVVKAQLEHETWRKYTDPEAFKKKHAAEYLPVCEKALRQYTGGHNDPDVALWVLSDLFKQDQVHRLSSALLMQLTDRYGLPGGNLVSKEPDFDPELSVLMAQQVREQFRQQCEQNRQK